MFKNNLKGLDLSIFTKKYRDSERNEFHKKNQYEGFSEVEKELLKKSIIPDNLSKLHQSYGRAGVVVRNNESKNFKAMCEAVLNKMVKLDLSKNYNYFTNPGGKPDFETVHECITREVKEELGLFLKTDKPMEINFSIKLDDSYSGFSVVEVDDLSMKCLKDIKLHKKSEFKGGEFMTLDFFEKRVVDNSPEGYLEFNEKLFEILTKILKSENTEEILDTTEKINQDQQKIKS